MRDLQAARGTPLRRSPVTYLASAAALVLAADVATKVWAVERLSGREIDTLGGLVVLHLHRNPGAAFGLAGGATVVFSLIALVIVGVIVRVARQLASRWWAVALGLLLGGASGNLLDRLLRSPGPLRGHVVDFIDLHWNGRSVWPVFNVADMAIVTGAALALLLSVRGVEMTPPGDTEA
ncbi:MAG TPA: signal peptidase II [Frankiaceae bacterium]|nr:signal peptidase II [Frankiaceae bacterium]